MHCTEILFTPRCSSRATEFPRSVNFSLRRTVAELRGVKVAKFSNFGLFSPYKTPKTYLPLTSLQPRGYIAEWFRFFHMIVEGPNGCRRFPATSGRGAAWGPSYVPKFSPMANGYIHTNFNCTARQTWTKDVWKRAILRTDVGLLSHQISSLIPPKSPKTPFLGTFQCKTYYTDRSHRLMELRRWNFTAYRHVLGGVSTFFR